MSPFARPADNLRFLDWAADFKTLGPSFFARETEATSVKMLDDT